MMSHFPIERAMPPARLGVMRLTETLAAEAWDYGVRVFAMAPGLVKTALTDHHMERSDAAQLWPQVVAAFA